MTGPNLETSHTPNQPYDNPRQKSREPRPNHKDLKEYKQSQQLYNCKSENTKPDTINDSSAGPQTGKIIFFEFLIFFDFFTAVFGPARGFKGFLDPTGIDSDQIWAKTDPPRPNSLPKLRFSAFWRFLHMHMAYAYGICIRHLRICHMPMAYAYGKCIWHTHMAYVYGIFICAYAVCICDMHMP